MKNLDTLKVFVALVASSLFAFTANAQLDSCNVFLQGNYIEVGICQNGGYGSTINAPITYVANPSCSASFYDPCDSTATYSTRSSNVGFVADPDKDGWAVGTPAYFGDYFLPGYPQEGWAIEVGGTEATAYTNNLTVSGATGYSGTGGSYLSGENVSYTNVGNRREGKWVGEYDLSSSEKLAITQTTSLDTGNVFFIIYVTFKNIGTATLNNIYYLRTLDPDNDQTRSGSFSTRNVVNYKLPNPDNKVMVSTWGQTYSKAFIGLGTEDCRAKAFVVTSGLVPTDNIDKLYNQSSGVSANYDSLNADVGVGLAYSLGDLAPGDSTAITYAYVLSIAELDSAFAATRPRWTYSGDSSTLYSNDTASVCKNSISTVGILNGGAYNWTWHVAPATTPISPTTGPTVNVTVGTSPVFVMATGTSPACFKDTIRMTLVPNRTPPMPPAKIYTYCQYEVASHLTATGTNLLWYTSDTGGTGSITAPTPNTDTPGTKYYWLTQTIKGCESDRTKMTVIVHAGSVDSFATDIHYGCSEDTVQFINLTTGVITSNLWDFGDGTQDSVKNPLHIYTSQGTYTVKLTTLNAYNCKYSKTQTVTISHPLTSSFTVTPDTTCEFKNLTFTATSTGTAPLGYLWIFGDGTTATTATATHSYNNTGVYNVALVTSDFVPCGDTAYKSVFIDTFATADFVPSDSFICEGKSITFYGDYSAIGNVGAIWHFGDGSTLLNTKQPHHSFDAPGTYTVSLTAKYRQCPDTTVVKTITVHGLPLVNLGPDTAMCPNSGSITLMDIANASNGSAQWLWNTGATTSSISVDEPGIYYTTVTINGCSNSDSIDVRKDCYIDIPNAFTPNGDGVNDYFFPRSLLSSGVTKFKMDIYNRWGQLVFETSNIDGRGWDGKFNGTDQPDGVYIYMIDATIKNGETKHFQGNLTLLR